MMLQANSITKLKFYTNIIGDKVLVVSKRMMLV